MLYRDTHRSRRVAIALGVASLIAAILFSNSPILGELSPANSIEQGAQDANTSAGLPRIGTTDTVVYIEVKAGGPIPLPVDA